jgi:MFS family permease
MKTGSHGLRDHIRLLTPLFGLIAAVWLLRLVLDKAGSPPTLVRMVSVTVASAASILLAVLVIHFKAFGSYASVALAAFLLELWSQLLICAAIAFSAITGTANIYTATRYSFHSRPVAHIVGHLTGSLGSGTLLGAAMGCLLLWMLRRIVPERPGKTQVKSNL